VSGPPWWWWALMAVLLVVTAPLAVRFMVLLLGSS
jgi:hypothetical protein